MAKRTIKEKYEKIKARDTPKKEYRGVITVSAETDIAVSAIKFVGGDRNGI